MSDEPDVKATTKIPDCLPCRLVGTGGALGGAVYIAYQSTKFQTTPGRVATLSLSSALVVLGFWRWNK